MVSHYGNSLSKALLAVFPYIGLKKNKFYKNTGTTTYVGGEEGERRERGGDERRRGGEEGELQRRRISNLV